MEVLMFRREASLALASLIAFGATVAGAQPVDLKRYRTVDLTHALNAKTLGLRE